MSLLTLHNIFIGYDKKQVLFDASLDIIEGETFLVIGSTALEKPHLLKQFMNYYLYGKAK